MAADCEQTRARMLELLYGELGPDARAEIDGHVAGCPACRTELSALQSTRALARRALETDEPPARARIAILQAAAAAGPRREPAPAVRPPATRPSLWSRLRGRWTLPTFATIGAVAVFLLASRIFLEPDKTYQRGRQGLLPAPSGPPRAEPATPPPTTAIFSPKAKRAEPRTDAKPAVTVKRKRSPAPDQPGAQLFDRDEPGDEAAAAKLAPAKKTALGAPETFAAPAAAPVPPGAGSGAQPPESAAARADRLFTQRRWAEAAIAYRELLRDDPRNADAPRWRQRLAVSEAAANAP